MDVKRIKFGTKIRITSNPNSKYLKPGDTGIIVRSDYFHDDEITDRDGYYWIDINHPEYEHICFGSPSNPSCFKILKY